MAEFQEVMRQYIRLCKSLGSDEQAKKCKSCPISCKNNSTGIPCDDVLWLEPQISEEIIMKWAAEHPEPKYPTWREWHKAEFPNAGSNISPCHFMPRDECCKDYHCRNCDIQPIPAHIAEKLGIKPIKED